MFLDRNRADSDSLTICTFVFMPCRILLTLRLKSWEPFEIGIAWLVVVLNDDQPSFYTNPLGPQPRGLTFVFFFFSMLRIVSPASRFTSTGLLGKVAASTHNTPHTSSVVSSVQCAVC
jgi:hypothetical protein